MMHGSAVAIAWVVFVPLHSRPHHPGKSEAGFTLLEMIIVVAVLGVLLTISGGALMRLFRDSKADSGMAAVMNTFRLARDRAIGERRLFEIEFVAPNRIKIWRVEIPAPDKTLVIDTYLTGNLEFLQVAGAGDTGDGFGYASATAFGSSPSRKFTSEGSFVDSVLDPLNGTLFVAAKGQPTTGRAITILGATAAIHGWRWDGRQWVE